jgi:hypothetical protein
MGTQVLAYASSIFFFFSLWHAPMSKIFYLTCVYLNYIQGSKSNTHIVIYSQSQSFTRIPSKDFSCEDWNTKAAAIQNMGDDSTPIGSREEAGGDAQRAPADGDDVQIADGGAEHAEEVTGEVDVDAKTESTAGQQVQHLSHFFTLPLHHIPRSTAGVVGEVVVEVEKNSGADEQVQHLSHFLYQSFLTFFYLSHFLHCPSIRFLEIVLATLQPNPVRQGAVLPQSLMISSVA